MRRLVYFLLFFLGCSLHHPPGNRPLRRPFSLVFLHSLGESGTQLGQFRRPWGICPDVEGNIYVADSGNRRISKLDEMGRGVSEYRGDMVGGFGEPAGIASDGFYIYVADLKKGEIVRVDPERHLSQLVPQQVGRRISPWGIEATSAGELWVSDRENSRVLMFDEMGRFRGSSGRYGNGPGEFRRPSGIGVDGSRKVYVCDPERRVIEVFDPLGGHLHSIRSEEPPVDVDIDAYGNLFIASPNRIWVMGDRGKILDREGPKTPGGIMVKDERLYLTDPESDRVLVFEILYSGD